MGFEGQEEKGSDLEEGEEAYQEEVLEVLGKGERERMGR